MLHISRIVNDSAKPMLRNKRGSAWRGGLRSTVLLLGLLSACHCSGRGIKVGKHRCYQLLRGSILCSLAFLQSGVRWLGQSILGSCLLRPGLLAKPGFVGCGLFRFGMVTSPSMLG